MMTDKGEIVTFESLKEKLVLLALAMGKSRATELLVKYGGKRLADLPKSAYVAVFQEAEAIIYSKADQHDNDAERAEVLQNEVAAAYHATRADQLRKGLFDEPNGAAPLPWSQWQHNTSGDLYAVICVTNKLAEKPDYPVSVVYMSLQGSGTMYSHTLDKWHGRMTYIKMLDPQQRGLVLADLGAFTSEPCLTDT